MRSTVVKVSLTTTAAFVLALSACGGSDDSADATSEAVTAEIEEICAERARSVADRGDFPIADFDPEHPSAADLPAVGDYFAAGLNEGPRAIAKLNALSATGEQREQLDALIAAWEAEYAGAKDQVDAALAADVDAFVATLDGAVASKDAFAEATSALGVPDCGQG